jgi:cytochrome c biogenesis protein CcmG/thiol:disulfide interchange protein DsbE
MLLNNPFRRRFYAGLRIGLLAVLGFAGTPAQAQVQLPTIKFVRDPDLAPDFKLKNLDGKDLTLADSRGRVILLNFWATWCGPCRAEIPSLIELQKRYADRLQIIGLDVDDDDEGMVRQVVASEGINYPVALASTEVRIAYGGIGALPTVFVLNADGRVVQKHVGLFNPALYETEVRALLNLPVAARVVTFEDTGEVFLKHADRATDLPGVKLSKLSAQQRIVALHKFNAEECTCGCKMTLAQCRIYDAGCKLSADRTAQIVKEIYAAGEKEKAVSPESAPTQNEPAIPLADPASAPSPDPANAKPATPPQPTPPESGKP